MQNSSYFLITVSMGLCFVIIFCTILLHHRASIYFWDKLFSNPYLDVGTLRKMRQSTFKQSLLMYGIYVSSVICGLLLFLCHVSNEFGILFCKYGITFCVISYFMTKVFFYGYLLERAVLIQNDNHWIVSPFIMTKIIPIYLFLYFIINSILIAIYFRGKSNNNNSNQFIECQFDTFIPNLFSISSILDILHCVILTILFLGPNCKDIYYNKSEIFNTPQQIRTFVGQTNIHLLCIIVSCVSSVIFMLFIDKHNLLYIYGNINIMINSIFTFLTLSSNRDYLKSHLICKCCKYIFQCKCNKLYNKLSNVFCCNYCNCIHYVQTLCYERNDIPAIQNDQSIPIATCFGNISLLTQPESWNSNPTLSVSVRKSKTYPLHDHDDHP
eukprot:329473_1